MMSNMVHKPLAPYGIRGQLNQKVTSDTVNLIFRQWRHQVVWLPKLMYFWIDHPNWYMSLKMQPNLLLSAANKARVRITRLLLTAKNTNGTFVNELDTTYVVTSTRISKSSVHRTMKELQILGLVEIGKTRDPSHENFIELKEESPSEPTESPVRLFKLCLRWIHSYLMGRVLRFRFHLKKRLVRDLLTCVRLLSTSWILLIYQSLSLLQ
jgi:hypothetical protein